MLNVEMLFIAEWKLKKKHNRMKEMASFNKQFGALSHL